MPLKENVSKAFYSNCLIEAVKAKIKDWKNVSIKKIPAYINVDKNVHFYWINKKENKIYEFYGAKENNINHIFFKGNIVKTSHKRHEILLNMGIKKLIKSLEKEHNFTSYYTETIKKLTTTMPYWELYSDSIPRESFTENNSYPYVLGCYRENGKLIIKSYEIGEEKGLVNPDNDKIDYWKKCTVSLPL